ncbi:DUF58 domain-containing protein [Trueperella sp. LYQ143]|uniref:DUF58 domain-containing protein n=1 Tax=unclassified Trueperella TaxID=2630174 RepID=UPI0039835E78
MRSNVTRMALVRARLSLPVIRRASGVLEGRHTSVLTGHGHDFKDLVEYSFGDDVSDIDWKSSARAGMPIIRRFERESETIMQIVVDTGRQMCADAPDGSRKADIALCVADLLGYLAIQRGDRLAVMAGDNRGYLRIPARHGNSHLDYALDSVRAQMANSAEEMGSAGESACAVLFNELIRLPQPRSLVVAITDEYFPAVANQFDIAAIRRIRTRHELIVVQVADMLLTQPSIAHMHDVDHDFSVPAFLRADRVLHEDLVRDQRQREAYTRVVLRSFGVRSVRVDAMDHVVPALFELLRGRHAR